MDLKFHAQLTADDYLNAQRLHAGWRMFVRMSLLIFILMTAVGMAITELGRDRFWIGPVAWTIWFVFFCFIYPATVAKRSRKIFGQQKNLQIPREIEICDTHVSAKSERGVGTTPWNEFHKWKANDRIILVYSSDLLFQMFPRHWFASDAEFVGFKELLAQVIGPMGKARKA
jgi:hypothetical protein